MVLAHDGERGDAAEGDGAAGIDEHLVAVAVDDEVAVEDLEGECVGIVLYSLVVFLLFLVAMELGHESQGVIQG